MELKSLAIDFPQDERRIIDELKIAGCSLSWEDCQWSSEQADSIQKKMLESHLALVGGESRIEIYKSIKRRSVSSHFMNYVDLVTNEKGELWGHSVFSSVFKECLLGAIQNQDFKGAVIFLGFTPLVLPTIDILAKFGFEDFVFLSLDGSDLSLARYKKYMTGLINTRISSVNSSDFVQSQKEYSFCFVVEQHYSSQILEDMSYFHFLSNQSLVFDLSGRSNFLFKEVKALGVEVVDFATIEAIQIRQTMEMVQKYVEKLG